MTETSSSPPLLTSKLQPKAPLLSEDYHIVLILTNGLTTNGEGATTGSFAYAAVKAGAGADASEGDKAAELPARLYRAGLCPSVLTPLLALAAFSLRLPMPSPEVLLP